MAKKAARKKTAKKKAAKRAVKKAATKKAVKKAVRKAVPRAAAAMPRKADIPGYDPMRPDGSNWQLAAQALRIRPFYTGPGSKPFSCLRAQQLPDPQRGNAPFNDFYLAPECRD